MARGSLNLKVSKDDFEKRISIIEIRMANLVDVIESYNNAKRNLDQFIESEDSAYDAMLERIEENVNAAKKAHAALNETKLSLEETVRLMDNMGKEVKETITTGAEAASSVIKAAIKIDSIL